jgi:membrane protein
LIITLFITTLSEALNNYFDYGEVVAVILNFILSTSIITVLFALMFKYLPDVKITWKDVWLGAFITTILFTIGKYLLGYYIKYTHTGSEFGAAAGIITILVWVYYSAHLFYLGSEFTRVYATRDGRRIIPSKKAVLIPQAHR